MKTALPSTTKDTSVQCTINSRKNSMTDERKVTPRCHRNCSDQGVAALLLLINCFSIMELLGQTTIIT